MGGRSAKQQSQNGNFGYWPFAALFANHPGLGLAPFFGPGVFGGYGLGGLGGYGGYGCGYGLGGLAGLGGLGGYGLGAGLGPLAFPYGGLPFGPYGGAPGLPTSGNLNLKDSLSGATMKLKW